MKFPMRSAHQYFLSDSQPPLLSALSKNSVVQNDTSLSLSFCTHSTNLVSFGIYHSGSCSDVGGELQRKNRKECTCGMCTCVYVRLCSLAGFISEAPKSGDSQKPCLLGNHVGSQTRGSRFQYLSEETFVSLTSAFLNYLSHFFLCLLPRFFRGSLTYTT